MRPLFVALLTLSALLFAGCFKDPKPVDCTFDPCALKAPQAQIDSVKAYLDSMGITATQHCSGMFYKLTADGNGTQPGACTKVGVTYRGMLVNGNVFDQSTTGIMLALSNVIRGWTIGVPLIKQGGAITLYIPPSLGYGTQARTDQNGNIVIPANSILIFDIGLVAVY